MNSFINDSSVAAAGFSADNPVTNALIKNIKGELPTKKPILRVRCDVCNCEMATHVELGIHEAGARHKKHLKRKETFEKLKGDSVSLGLDMQGAKVNSAFACKPCNVDLVTIEQVENHVQSGKHKRRAIASDLQPPYIAVSIPLENDITDGAPPVKKKKEEVEPYYCELCQVYLTSIVQWKAHLLSRKHMRKQNPQPNVFVRKQPRATTWNKFKKPIQGDSHSYNCSNNLKNSQSSRYFNQQNKPWLSKTIGGNQNEPWLSKTSGGNQNEPWLSKINGGNQNRSTNNPVFSRPNYANDPERINRHKELWYGNASNFPTTLVPPPPPPEPFIKLN